MGQIDAELEKLSDPKLQKFKEQNFDDIRANCLSAGTKWTDDEFGHDKKALGESLSKRIKEDHPKAKIEWRRVHEISKDARLFIQGPPREDVDDVNQGWLGDCWFVAPAASLSIHGYLLKKVIPHSDQQELNREDYCGILLFRFHRFGKWVEVVVDDYLPTYYNEQNELKLAFMHSNKSNEFWAALLEKAYAKIDGSYGDLRGGRTADALNDLTGGISEEIYFKELRESESARQKVCRQLKIALSRKQPSLVTREGCFLERAIFSCLQTYYIESSMSVNQCMEGGKAEDWTRWKACFQSS